MASLSSDTTLALVQEFLPHMSGQGAPVTNQAGTAETSNDEGGRTRDAPRIPLAPGYLCGLYQAGHDDRVQVAQRGVHQAAHDGPVPRCAPADEGAIG